MSALVSDDLAPELCAAGARVGLDILLCDRQRLEHAEVLPDVLILDATLDAGLHRDDSSRVARIPRVVVVPEVTGAFLTLADRCGVDAVVVRPVDPLTLRRAIVQANAPHPDQVASRVSALPPRVGGASAEMQRVWRLAMHGSQSASSAMITGETGVGKEVVARVLHRFSPRRAGPFVAVNCAALPESLLESELFGHEKGSFTGATTRRSGRFELAHGGTLFLDEIGDLPQSVQVSLLRVLQERRFERVGGADSISVDVRVIAATHRNLEIDVEEGRFRADLFYRLNVLPIHVAPLRERKSDIAELWQQFLSEGADKQQRPLPDTSPEALRRLIRHDWPGNVRELHNVAQHALAVTTDAQIRLADLPAPLSSDPNVAGRRLGLAGMTLKEIERAAILESYDAYGTVRATADALGISERKIHYRLKEYREAETASTSGATNVRILLAEDDDEVRWTLTEFLRSEGYEVIPVADGRSLLEQLGATLLMDDDERVSADVIVSDVRMPGLTGMQLLERVRARGWTTPVILISAFGDPEMRRLATSMGANAFLPKPIDPVAFHRVIEGVVNADR